MATSQSSGMIMMLDQMDPLTLFGRMDGIPILFVPRGEYSIPPVSQCRCRRRRRRCDSRSTTSTSTSTSDSDSNANVCSFNCIDIHIKRKFNQLFHPECLAAAN